MFEIYHNGSLQGWILVKEKNYNGVHPGPDVCKRHENASHSYYKK